MSYTWFHSILIKNLLPIPPIQYTNKKVVINYFPLLGLGGNMPYKQSNCIT